MIGRTVALLLILLVAVAAAGVVWAQTSPHYDLSWHVLSAGGQEGMASGGHIVHGTLSQLAIGPAHSSHAVGSGYWYGPRPPAEAGFQVYLPVVLKGY